MVKGAPKGNNFAKKLKTPDLKKEAYGSYCKWIESGKSHKSWCFEKGELLLTWQTMETYIKNEPKDFNQKHKEAAISKSLEKWEKRGEALIESEKRCQPAIYQMFMRNKFGWDKETPEEKTERRRDEGSILETIFREIKGK
ncbi:MAG: hypothetical protein IMZ64_05180 [Bacteroidetes bacterium]|nr:hypothetical protein [Bacteroidota bacterium]